MRELIRRDWLFFALVGVGAVLLRVVFLVYFPSVVNDSFIYGDIAKNWLQHGIYGISTAAGPAATYIRLPGYPSFLALIFSVFGMEHYRAVLVTQLFVDLGTCLVCASIALRLLGPRSAKATLLLSALCPFFANYSAAALTETLEIFFTALALDLALRAFQSEATKFWIGCGLCCACAISLRPDGAMLPFVIAIYALWRMLVREGTPERRKRLALGLILFAGVSTAPLVPWAIRNWRVFHQFQPLAPRYANEENEFVPEGFNRWTKTWMADYASVEEVYWAVPGQAIDLSRLPSRAFDDLGQRATTAALIDDYNALLHISPALDARFAALARQRIADHPVRYYVCLPVLRIADMWLRPRTEMLPSDTRWWEFNDEPKWSVLAVALGGVGIFYVVTGLIGWIRSRPIEYGGLLLLFLAMRSAFLGTLENPEPRYTLELYPVLIVLAAGAFLRSRTLTST